MWLACVEVYLILNIRLSDLSECKFQLNFWLIKHFPLLSSLWTSPTVNHMKMSYVHFFTNWLEKPDSNSSKHSKYCMFYLEIHKRINTWHIIGTLFYLVVEQHILLTWNVHFNENQTGLECFNSVCTQDLSHKMVI